MRDALVRVAAALWTLAIVSCLAIGAAAPASWQAAIASDGPGCPFRAITGIECPFCGMTRATLAIGRGDLHAALALHPFAPVVLLGILALLAVIVAGRSEVLVRGARPYALLGAIILIWALRLIV